MPAPAPAQPALAGTHWQLTALQGHTPIAGTKITLSINPYFLSGSAGCNTYGNSPDSGPYQTSLAGTLVITQTAVTAMLCLGPAGVMEQEQIYIGTLQQAATYRISHEQLEIFNAAGKTLLVFSKAQ